MGLNFMRRQHRLRCPTVARITRVPENGKVAAMDSNRTFLDLSSRQIILRTLGGERNRIVVASILLSVNQLGEALLPVLAGAVIDKALDETQVGVPWIVIIIGLPVACALIAVGYLVGTRVSDRARIGSMQRLRLDASATAVGSSDRLDWAGAPDETFTTLTSDTARVASVTGKISYSVCAAVAIMVATVILFSISWAIGLVILVGSPLVFWAVHRVSRPILDRSLREQTAMAGSVSLAIDFLQGFRVLRGIGGEEEAMRRYRISSQDAARAYLSSASASSRLSAVAVLTTGLYLACVASVGVVLALNGQIAVGQLIASFGLAQYLAWPIQVLMDLAPSLAQAKASAGRLLKLGTNSSEDGVGAATTAFTKVELIEFRRCTAKNISDFSLVVHGAGLRGLVSWHEGVVDEICDLLAKEIDPVAGELRVGPLNYLDVAASDAAAIAVVAPHNAAVFSGDLGSNVFGTDDWRDESGERLHDLMAMVVATDIEREVSDRSTQDIGEFGSRLSGGQRQRLALARAVAKETPLLVLQDPTSALDSVTESRLIPQVKKHRAGRLTLVSTTSEAWLRQCDEIVVLGRHGAILRGTHDELSVTSSEYKALVS